MHLNLAFYLKMMRLSVGAVGYSPRLLMTLWMLGRLSEWHGIGLKMKIRDVWKHAYKR